MATTPDIGKLKRSYLMHYIDASFGGETPKWFLIGRDIEDMSVELNPDTETVKNILDETVVNDNGYEPSIDADTYYANTGDAIYENGTREIYVADENGPRKLTKDEELSNLDAAYKKTVDDFVTMETTNQHARGIIGEEMNKISKITTRSTLASAYIEEQKTRGKDEITENLGKKMYGAITSFKEKYTMIQPNREQLLMSIKI